MLENIIRNPIETSRGYKNPGNGIALRGPLSQFFSGIFLKKLDDVFDNMQVNYLRYQDDIIVLCKTYRQLNRCRKRMMEILHERGLSLSRKKSRMGCVNQRFHFLGIYYPPTQTEDNIKATHAAHNKYLLIERILTAGTNDKAQLFLFDNYAGVGALKRVISAYDFEILAIIRAAASCFSY